MAAISYFRDSETRGSLPQNWRYTYRVAAFGGPIGKLLLNFKSLFVGVVVAAKKMNAVTDTVARVHVTLGQIGPMGLI
jgi:hypothetical protein